VWTQFYHGLFELLAPRRCAACEAVDAAKSGFCGACDLLIERRSTLGATESADLAAADYGGPLSDAIHGLKYGGDTTRVAALVALLQPQAMRLRGRVDLVTCVPLHPRRLYERGFNQAALLARPVARTLAVPFDARLLRRLRDTPQQAGAGRRARLEMARASIACRRELRRASVLVVDDVRTTGSTLCSAREALLTAGAASVFTLVVAAVDDGDDNPA
jgi:ComF family protein